MDNMDRAVAKKHPLKKYRFHIIIGLMLIGLVTYLLATTAGGRKYRISGDELYIEEASLAPFHEFVDVEGLVQPIFTLKVNAPEQGNVAYIVAEEGAMLRQGDTILVLKNTNLVREVEDGKDDYEKQLLSFREKEIEMQQRTISLQQQALQTQYEVSRLEKDYLLDLQEFKMGVKSRPQLDLSKEEYDYKKASTNLQIETLRQDSIMTLIRADLMRNDLERERKKQIRLQQRIDNLTVTAPIAGQLSYVNATPGQQIVAGAEIAEIKVLDQFKMHAKVSEYYIERIMSGLPASIAWQGRKYPLKISRIIPEVKEREFRIDLVFIDEVPDNIRIGKTYRMQIELGQSEEAVVISHGNFFQATGGQWIYKLNDTGTKAIKQPITIGRQNPKQYEILEGLTPGDRVIISGYDRFGGADEIVIR